MSKLENVLSLLQQNFKKSMQHISQNSLTFHLLRFPSFLLLFQLDLIIQLSGRKRVSIPFTCLFFILFLWALFLYDHLQKRSFQIIAKLDEHCIFRFSEFFLMPWIVLIHFLIRIYCTFLWYTLSSLWYSRGIFQAIMKWTQMNTPNSYFTPPF